MVFKILLLIIIIIIIIMSTNSDSILNIHSNVEDRRNLEKMKVNEQSDCRIKIDQEMKVENRRQGGKTSKCTKIETYKYNPSVYK